VAEIIRITAPDTVLVGTTFDITATAVLGALDCCEYDHSDFTRTCSCLALQVWTKRTNHGAAEPCVTVAKDLTFEIHATEPGEFHVIAFEPDRSPTLKTISVLP